MPSPIATPSFQTGTFHPPAAPATQQDMTRRGIGNEFVIQVIGNTGVLDGARMMQPVPTRSPLQSTEWVDYVDHLKACGKVPGAGHHDPEKGVVHANNVRVSNLRAFLLSQATSTVIHVPHPVCVDHVGSRFVPQAQCAVSEVICASAENEAVQPPREPVCSDPAVSQTVPSRMDADEELAGAAVILEGDAPGDQQPAVFADAEDDCVHDGDDRIPNSWLGVDPVSTDATRQVHDMEIDDADCWEPQNVHAITGTPSGVSVQESVGDEESGLEAHSVAQDPAWLSCESSDAQHGDAEDAEDVPRRRRSSEEIANARMARLKTMAFANTKLSLQPSLKVKHADRLEFTAYDVVAYYDKEKPASGADVAITSGRGMLCAQLPFESGQVMHAKRFDGSWSDLSPQAVRDVDFLEPRVGYEVRDGRLERRSHFVLFERTGAPSRAVFHDSAGEASDVDGSDGEGDDSSCRAAGSKAFLHDIGLPIGRVDVDELSSDDEAAYF